VRKTPAFAPLFPALCIAAITTLKASSSKRELPMQTSRTSTLNHLIFPPAQPSLTKGGGVDAGLAQQTGGEKPDVVVGDPAKTVAARETRPVPQKLATEAATPQPGVVYTGTAESLRGEAKKHGVDVDKLPLDALISFGQSRGFFTKITYSKEGVMGGLKALGPEQPTAGSDFVSTAVNVMRDFEEGLTALRGPAGKDNARLWNFFSRSSTLSST
jgi:hypothetical protein